MNGNTENINLKTRNEHAVGKFKTWKTKILPFLVYILAILVSLDFITLVIGAINIHKCPAGPYIPIFLIVTGAVGIVAKLVTHCKQKLNEEYLTQINYIESFLHATSLLFFILGSVWTYRIYKPSFDENDEYYCNITCYLYAFIYITVIYSLIMAVAFMMCCAFCCLMCSATVFLAVEHGEPV